MAAIRSQYFVKSVADSIGDWTITVVEISVSTAALANVATGRLQAEVATRVLGKAIDTEAAAVATLMDSLSMSEPAGLTFSPSGLSSGRESRFIADL